jgi:hypothetical protein
VVQDESVLEQMVVVEDEVVVVQDEVVVEAAASCQPVPVSLTDSHAMVVEVAASEVEQGKGGKECSKTGQHTVVTLLLMLLPCHYTAVTS